MSDTNPPSEISKRPLLWALLLGFAPSVALLLAVFTAGQDGRNLGTNGFIAFCAGSLICCFSSSFLMVRRRTTLAIVSGILLFLLNFCISFFFGCIAFFA
jgi:hypothetical protein